MKIAAYMYIAIISCYVGTAGQYVHNMTCLVIIANNVSCNIKGYQCTSRLLNYKQAIISKMVT